MQTDTIYIVGAGAIGKVLAVLLAQQQKKVIILRGSVEEANPQKEKIQVQLSSGETMEAAIEISSLSRYAMLKGLVVLTNKSFGNQRLADLLKPLINDTPLVLLQNGLNVEQPFTAHAFPHIYRCVLFATSQPNAVNRFSFKPVAASPIGIINGNKEMLAAVVEQLNNPWFPFRAGEDIQPVIWTKAIVNSVFNSVCPLLETDNGIFYRNRQALAVAERVITEGVAVAAANGIALHTPQVIQTLLSISNSADGQLISTYQDILNKRPTEIDTLNVAIVNSATDKTLVKETALLGELVKIKSALNGG